jgi:quercetin dioxygenase-like cupin family protein
MITANILKDVVFNDDNPAITVLYKSPTTKEVRIAFKANQKMKEHQTPYPISVEMVDGDLDFGVEGTIHSLTKGDMLYLDGAIPHDLHAKTNAIVRLTLSTGDTVQRVKTVIAES